jgi:ATP-dependent exoDNAse (exonuclease V) alpha subunit
MIQQQSLKILLSSCNVFLTGPPGSGKTYLLNRYISIAKSKGLKVAITATTGIASTHINGITIHSWSGIGIRDNLEKKHLNSIARNKRIVDRFLTTDVLVIDEVSMLSSIRLDLINLVMKNIRKSSDAMGGIKVILVGDLFQLPPVDIKESNYIFNSKCWNELRLKICYLSEQHRQRQGDEINSILRSIRSNTLGRSEIDLLESRIIQHQPNPNMLRLYTHNYDADKVNKERQERLIGKERIYVSQTKGFKKEVDKLKKTILSPEFLNLKKGSQVIFTANNYHEGYVNGDRGYVVTFKSGQPVIRLKKGVYLEVQKHKWSREVDGKIVAEVWQLPLKLSWAITIHKSQGMSLEEAQIDLRHSFLPGMGYVALSRLKSIDGLYLLGINKIALYVDSNILKIDKILKAQSDNLMIE